MDRKAAYQAYLAAREARWLWGIGSVWKRYDGEEITIIEVAADARTGEPVMVYRHDYVWMLPLAEFNAPVTLPDGTQIARFTWLRGRDG